MTLVKRHSALKALFEKRGCVVAPAAFDCLSAKLVEEAGFGVVYIGSYGTSASLFGLPDVGMLSLDELASHARRVVDAVKVPVIADAEGGQDEPGNIWRTVREFEKAGVSAIHIEDHSGGKHTGLAQGVIPLDRMLAKLRGALQARSDPDFQIIARTDAIYATGDVDEALRRVRAFAELGVDMVFPSGASLDVVRAIRAELGTRVVITEKPAGPAFAASAAADLVIHYGFCLYAASMGISEALRQYREGFRPENMTPYLEDPHAFERRMGYADVEVRSRQARGETTR